MMKRMLTFLPILFISVSSYAASLNADDKSLYFNSNVLINVIKGTFDKELQLDVANKYVSLMDENGNVSVADLISVCSVGKLTNGQCKNFIKSLFNTNPDIDRFYWADFINTHNDAYDGIIDRGDKGGTWYVVPGWIRETKAFERMYPGVTRISGTSACTAERGTKFTAYLDKKFTDNEKSGHQCWCKMTSPAESAWVYLFALENADSCAEKCAFHCNMNMGYNYQDSKPANVYGPQGENHTLAYVYHENNYSDFRKAGIDMRRAMFTTVVGYNITSDSQPQPIAKSDIKKDLNKEFNPPVPPVKPKPKPKEQEPEKSEESEKCQVDWNEAAREIKRISHADDLDNCPYVHDIGEDLMVLMFDARDPSQALTDAFWCRYHAAPHANIMAKCVIDDGNNKNLFGFDFELRQSATKKLNIDNWDNPCYKRAKCFCKMIEPDTTKWIHMADTSVMAYRSSSQVLGKVICHDKRTDSRMQTDCHNDCYHVCAERGNIIKIFQSLGVR